jgi:hypothetical protein
LTLYQWFTILGLPTLAGLLIKMIAFQVQAKIDARRDIEAERKQQKSTNRVILRMLLRARGELYLKRGYATLAEKDDFEACYVEYHNNGGNGVMDAFHDDVIDLPAEDGREIE